MDKFIRRIAVDYLNAAMGDDPDGSVICFRDVRHAAGTPEGQATLAAVYEKEFYEIPQAAEPFQVTCDTILPWTFYVVGARAGDAPPSYAIPLSQVEVAYINIAPPEARKRLVADIVWQWELTHAREPTVAVQKALRDAGWEASEAKAWPRETGEEYWAWVYRRKDEH